MRQKEGRNAPSSYHDYIRILNYPSCFLLDYTNETFTRLKKFATLLPNNWLAETPETLVGEEAWQTVGGKGADF
ncbi:MULTISPECIES: hypothetical protein [Peribacillus]|uniref:hypothetical protein n=1 Tax=Peribacillus TaxID=2675229 RepID=UPI001F4E39DC|nr:MULTISPECIES: hypothetical protein [unclassified Peribacillus]MCK1985232.1 hypothetical protein [Peribacillus sp. Aquil_B1]MCK2007118.1 hypothetical protein [Peribacillus sp. Aquil_B8]